jgi:hypothetical protein
MALSQRFSDVTCDIVHVTTLKVDQKYPIVKAERVQTRYGETSAKHSRPTESKRQRLETSTYEGVPAEKICTSFQRRRYNKH